MNNECDCCLEQIEKTSKFCPHCGEEQGLISWDWKEYPPFGEIQARVNAISGDVKFEDVEKGDDQHYLRIVKA